MHPDDLATQGEPEPETAFDEGDTWVEDPRRLSRIDPAPIVLNLNTREGPTMR